MQAEETITLLLRKEGLLVNQTLQAFVVGLVLVLTIFDNYPIGTSNYFILEVRVLAHLMDL